MKRIISISLILILVCSLVSAFADSSYVFPIGTYTVNENLPDSIYSISPNTKDKLKIKIVYDDEVITETELKPGKSIQSELLGGYQIIVESGEANINTQDLFPNAIPVESGVYKCPDMIDAGNYTIHGIDPLWTGVFIYDQEEVDSGSFHPFYEKKLDAGDSDSVAIAEGQYLCVDKPFYMEKTKKLFS